MEKKYLNFVDDTLYAPPVDAPLYNASSTSYSQSTPQNLTTAPPQTQGDVWSKLGSFVGGLLGTNKVAATPTYRPVVTTPVYKPPTSSTSWVMPVVLVGVLAVGGYMVYKKYGKK